MQQLLQFIFKCDANQAPILLCSILPKEGTTFLGGFCLFVCLFSRQLACGLTPVIANDLKKNIQVLAYCNDTYKQFKNT